MFLFDDLLHYKRLFNLHGKWVGWDVYSFPNARQGVSSSEHTLANRSPAGSVEAADRAPGRRTHFPDALVPFPNPPEHLPADDVADK